MICIEKAISQEWPYNTEGRPTFPIPRNAIISGLQGHLYGRIYTQQEQKNLLFDLGTILSALHESKEPEAAMGKGRERIPGGRRAMFVVGPSGAGKTSLITEILKRNSQPWSKHYVINADFLLREAMPRTYQKELLLKIDNESLQTVGEIRREIYNKWMPAAQTLSMILLVEAVNKGINIAYESTGDNPLMSNMITWIQGKEYKIRLIQVTALESIRFLSQQQRFTTIFKTPQLLEYIITLAKEKSEVIVSEKVKRQSSSFYKHISAYLFSGDYLELYFRSSLWRHSYPEPAALWNPQDRSLTIVNKEVYLALVAEYDRVSLMEGGTSWEEVCAAAHIRLPEV